MTPADPARPRRAHRRPDRRTRAAGYTMLEVMMSLAVLGVGVLGVVAVQHVTLRANSDARTVATATAIATSWVERLRTDGVQWNDPDTGPDLGQTRWLAQAAANPGVWFVPTSPPAGSGWALVDGTETYPGDGMAPAFCTHVRLTQVLPSLIRAEVRVFWRRDMSAMTDCSEADASLVETQTDRYGFVNLVTGIFHNVLQ